LEFINRHGDKIS